MYTNIRVSALKRQLQSLPDHQELWIEFYTGVNDALEVHRAPVRGICSTADGLLLTAGDEVKP